MGRLFLGLVMAGALLVVTGPQQTAVASTTAPVTADPTARLEPDACGPKTRKPNGKPWRCTFADDFTGKKLAKHWVEHPEKVPLGPGASCKKRKNVKVRHGQLQLTVSRTTSVLGCQFHVGAVTTYRMFSQKYGRFQARIKARGTKERGLQEAFWLWPDDRYNKEKDYPASGEIDISETYSQFPELSVPFLHYRKKQPDPSPQTAQDCKSTRGKWHTYTLLWGPERLEIKVDGKTCLINTSANRAFKKRYIICLSALNGVRGNGVSSETPLPSTMRVDWVKVWK
jgi:Glycosyl hydrolases family 16